MIPIFPRFTPLSIACSGDLQSLTGHLPPYTERSISCLHAWNINNSFMISKLHGNVILDVSFDKRRNITIIGTNSIPDTFKQVQHLLDAQNITVPFGLIPKETMLCLRDSNSFTVVEDRNNFDYLIDLQMVSNESSPPSRYVKRKMRKFLQNNYAVQFKPLGTITPVELSQFKRLFDVRHPHKSMPIREEYAALGRMLRYQDTLQLFTRGLYIDNRLEAFIVLEPMQHWLIAHFWKANTHFDGIYQYLIHACAKEFLTKGFTHMNIQEDKGIEGLRFTKQQFNPEFLKKYTIKQRRKLSPRVVSVKPANHQAFYQLALLPN